MPHLVLECSANVPDEPDFDRVLKRHAFDVETSPDIVCAIEGRRAGTTAILAAIGAPWMQR